MKKFPIVLLSTALIGWASQVHAQTVDLELLFLIDGSDSITSTQFNTQLQSYRSIFSNNFFNKYVSALPNKRLAVAAFQFGGTSVANAFLPVANWTFIGNQADANGFANNFVGVTKTGGFTPLGYAVERGADQLATNSYTGFSAMDLSSDGLSSTPPILDVDLEDARDYAQAQGVSVLNAIAPAGFLPGLDLLTYGVNITGSTQNTFVYPSINAFEATLGTKLANEIGRTPEPNLAVGLVGLGLLGIGHRWMNRK